MVGVPAETTGTATWRPTTGCLMGTSPSLAPYGGELVEGLFPYVLSLLLRRVLPRGPHQPEIPAPRPDDPSLRRCDLLQRQDNTPLDLEEGVDFQGAVSGKAAVADCADGILSMLGRSSVLSSRGPGQEGHQVCSDRPLWFNPGLTLKIVDCTERFTAGLKAGLHRSSYLEAVGALRQELTEAECRLAAIMLTDVVGHTTLSQRNEALALELLQANIPDCQLKGH